MKAQLQGQVQFLMHLQKGCVNIHMKGVVLPSGPMMYITLLLWVMFDVRTEVLHE
jgi:hypothetical protein